MFKIVSMGRIGKGRLSHTLVIYQDRDGKIEEPKVVPRDSHGKFTNDCPLYALVIYPKKDGSRGVGIYTEKMESNNKKLFRVRKSKGNYQEFFAHELEVFEMGHYSFSEKKQQWSFADSYVDLEYEFFSTDKFRHLEPRKYYDKKNYIGSTELHVLHNGKILSGFYLSAETSHEVDGGTIEKNNLNIVDTKTDVAVYITSENGKKLVVDWPKVVVDGPEDGKNSPKKYCYILKTKLENLLVEATGLENKCPQNTQVMGFVQGRQEEGAYQGVGPFGTHQVVTGRQEDGNPIYKYFFGSKLDTVDGWCKKEERLRLSKKSYVKFKNDWPLGTLVTWQRDDGSRRVGVYTKKKNSNGTDLFKVRKSLKKAKWFSSDKLEVFKIDGAKLYVLCKRKILGGFFLSCPTIDEVLVWITSENSKQLDKESSYSVVVGLNKLLVKATSLKPIIVPHLFLLDTAL